ncbi:MAG TPA: xylulokinase, partial [Candidatus Sulfomarinibacteraceae bacterium]|nr:xylulokinase [Candidatus Sulfomarinibacteraceae bacterium]
MGLVLGIDVSTTATKAVLVDPAGGVRGIGTAEYDFQIPQPLWSEQSPESWWVAAQAAIRAVLASTGTSGADVDAVGLTGQMHGAVLLDATGAVLRPAILWNDQRTGAECDEIRAAVGPERLIAITGNDAITGFTAPKLLWVRRHEPAAWARLAHVLLPKDYLRLRLTGEYAMDKADGAGTLLFDLAARTWSGEVLEALALDPAWFPPTFEGPAVTGTVTRSAAAATGLREGTPVVAGGGDQAANAVGVGVVAEGTVALSLGTSGVIFATTHAPLHEARGRVHAFCHAVPGRWHLMSVMLSAAGSLRWFRDALAPGDGFADLTASAGEVRAATDGLFFLPYLTGERSPHPDPRARGAFVGLTLGHDRRHLTRAVLEGVAFGLRDGLDLMLAAGMPRPAEIRASGGGLASPLWRQVLADVLDADLVTTSTTEGAAFGAAILGAVGAGWFADVPAAAAALVQTSPAASVGPGRTAYADAHAVYRELYPALAPIFHRDRALEPGP